MTKAPITATKPKTPRATKPKHPTEFRIINIIGSQVVVETSLSAYVKDGWNVTVLSIQTGLTQLVVNGYITK